MALNTYNDLIAGVQAWIEESGSEFVGNLDEIVGLAELRVVQDLDLAIFRRTATGVAMVVGTATVTKPTITPPDYLVAIKQVWITGGALTGPVVLTRKPAEVLIDYNSGAANGVPKYYADESETVLRFAPPPVATYSVVVRYLSRPNPLAVGNQSNWVSSNAWSLLFRAALVEAEKFIVADERVPTWEQDYQNTLIQTKRELYNMFGTQYDRLSAVPVPQIPRSRDQ